MIRSKSSEHQLERAYDLQAGKTAFVEKEAEESWRARRRRHTENRYFLAPHYRVHRRWLSSSFPAPTAAGVKRVIDIRLNNVSQLAGFAKRA